MKKEVIHTARAAVTGAPLVQAVKLGNLVFCSGASPRDPLQGNKVVEGGFTAQATQALANLKAVLEAAGSGFEHCLKATCFILDVDENLPLLNEVWVQHFGKNLPARTVVGVAKLRELPAGGRGHSLRSVISAEWPVCFWVQQFRENSPARTVVGVAVLRLEITGMFHGD